MKFAYLILANRNPRQLARLVNSLGLKDNTFLIHIDGSINKNIFLDAFGDFDQEKIHFLETRTEVIHGSITSVEAIMYLIKHLFKNNISFNYAHLISSLDYPLKNRTNISGFFKANKGKNFIETNVLSKQKWPHFGLDWIIYKWHANSKANLLYSDIEYIKSNKHWDIKPNCQLHGGSKYWSLNYDCVKFLFDECNESNSIYRCFRYSFQPERMLFHTMIMNSPFCSTVVSDDLRYTCRIEEPTKCRGITKNDFGTITKSEKIFASGIDGIEHENILDGLDYTIEAISRETFHATNEKPRCCVISAVGKTSLHRKWISESPKFTLHLIVYDDSIEEFSQDTPYITQDKGYKFKLIFRYLNNNKNIIDQYDYFYLPDDDIEIDTSSINKLFRYMEEYQLAVAQPAICNSYYSFQHTAKNPLSTLRYSNFVEIMQPCFSKEALKKVLFTFNANESGWGIDYHWGPIVNFNLLNTAIIDDVESIHTRPVASNHAKDRDKYMKLYNLSPDIRIIATIKNS